MTTTYQTTTHGDAISQHWDHSVPLSNDVGRVPLVSRTTGCLGRMDDCHAPKSRHGIQHGYAVGTLTCISQNPPFQRQNVLANNSYAFGFRNDTAQPDLTGTRILRSQRSGNMNTYAYDDRPAKDPYTAQSNRRPSISNPKNEAPRRKRSVGSGTNQEDFDDSAWIHRDKLAQIESKEMAQAGIRVRHGSRPGERSSESRSASRSASRVDNRRTQSRDRQPIPNPTYDEPTAPVLPSSQDYARDEVQRQAQNDEDDLDYDPAMLQIISPADKGQQSYGRSMTRPTPSSISRIPVARSSPAPLSTAVVARDSPLPRSKTGNAIGGSIGEKKSYQNHRARSQSLDSQGVMDQVIGSRPANSNRSRPASSHIQSPRSSMVAKDSPSGNPAKNKNAMYSTSSLQGRKGTNPRATPRSRTTSAARRNSPNTKANSASRPVSSSKRPQGDAPWIATMYKPDPRLPPDQQILPTHAKRMMQKDGQTGDAYDRDFNSLDDNDLAKMGAFPSPSPEVEQNPQFGKLQSPSKEQLGSESPWPLAGNKIHEVKKEKEGLHPGANGGYKITPTIAPPIAPPTSRPTASPQPTVQRVPDMDEKAGGKKEKGCACCIVM